MWKKLTSLALVISVIPSLISAHFDLDDFKGSFVFYGYSNAGIEFDVGNVELPLAQTNLSQVTFNKEGEGHVHFLSISIIPAIGTLSSNNCPANAPDLKVKLNLLNKHAGSGNLILTIGSNDESAVIYDFVAIKKGEKVVKLIAHRNFGTTKNPHCNEPITGSIPPVISSLLFGERQD